MATDTKTALLDHAEMVTRSKGFDGFSYADLAEAIGIRKASIHYHFPSKAALSEALMERYHTGVLSAFGQIDLMHPAAAARLEALIAFYREASNGGKTLCLCVSLIGSRESLNEEVMEKIRRFRRMVIDWIQTVFELAAEDRTISGLSDPESEARAVLALLEGAHLAARMDEKVETYDRAVKLLAARC